MTCTLKGHSYAYDLEQCVLNYFPSDAGHATSSLKYGSSFICASAIIETDDGMAKAFARAAYSGDPAEDTRRAKHILKLSFYRAALKLGRASPWGALTGIRPAKMADKLTRQYGTEARARAVLTGRYGVEPERLGMAFDTARAADRLRRSLEPRDIALYLGIPFCPSRCTYCSFISRAASTKLVTPFVDALCRELTATAELCRELHLRPVALYIGGGTPTSLSASELRRVLNTLGDSFALDTLLEYTVEAGRPDTIDAEKLDIILAAGATRLSVNPQTMHDDTLRRIGRAHSAKQARDAAMAVKNTGALLNMDLIAGLPGESAADLSSSLEQVLSIEPEHITLHTLARKKGAELSGAQIEHTRAGVSAGLTAAYSTLRQSGYRPYYLYRQKFMSGHFENTGWTRGRDGVYNLCMMEELCSTIAMGGGAVTKLYHPESGQISRLCNPKYPHEYIGAAEKLERNRAKISDWYKEKEPHL